MARLGPEMVERAKDLMALYPHTRSALVPILHLAQEQDGWLTQDAMEHVAELLDLTPAEVLGTASFYDMLFTHHVGRHLVSVCTNMACLLNGAYELLEHAEKSLGIRAGSTTPDDNFTLEEVECIALCGNAPCVAVNWRFFGDVTPNRFEQLVDDLRAGRLAEEVPPHGTLNRVRRDITAWSGAHGQPAPPREEGAAAAPSGPPREARGEDAPEPQPASLAATASAARDSAELQDAGEGEQDQQSGERK